MSFRVDGYVSTARPTVCCILLCAHLSSRELSKQDSCAPQHREEYPDVIRMVVVYSSKHFGGVRKMLVGTP